MDLRIVAEAAAVLCRQGGQVRLAAGVDEQVIDEAQGVVAGGAVDSHRRIQHLRRHRAGAGRQDLLQEQPAVADELAESARVADRIGQPVRVIDADAVDQILRAPPPHLGVHRVKDVRVLLPHPGQPGDGEEPPVAQQRLAPVDEPVVLSRVDLARRTTARAGGNVCRAGGDGEAVLEVVELGLAGVGAGWVDDDEVIHRIR